MTKQKYRVLSATGFRGHKKDETFEADLTPDEERRAKQRGSIRAVKSDDKNGGTKGE